jgi:hypothetical protein
MPIPFDLEPTMPAPLTPAEKALARLDRALAAMPERNAFHCAAKACEGCDVCAPEVQGGDCDDNEGDGGPWDFDDTTGTDDTAPTRAEIGERPLPPDVLTILYFMRDTILYARGPLSDAGLDSDQINAVLSVVDDATAEIESLDLVATLRGPR